MRLKIRKNLRAASPKQKLTSSYIKKSVAHEAVNILYFYSCRFLRIFLYFSDYDFLIPTLDTMTVQIGFNITRTHHFTACFTLI